jgi:PAS domain S-box-containing protein
VPDGIVVVNLTGHIIFANRLLETQFGYAHGELRGKLIETLLPPRFRRGHIMQRSSYVARAHTRAMGSGLELFGQRQDGSEFPVEISLSPLQMEGAWLVMSTVRDITERKRVETALVELSKHNEVLLREIQHRVGNSLQIIASILSLKARSVASEETRYHLRDAQQRVLAVAAVQQHLHNAAQGGMVRVTPYLSQLCDHLASSIIGENRPIAINVQADGNEIDSSHAVNLGLIVTELVINAIKYAFPGEDQVGHVTVSYQTNGRHWKLVVSDDGIGHAHSKAARPVAGGGLGASLVEALARQLDATVEIVSGTAGTSVSIVHA